MAVTPDATGLVWDQDPTALGLTRPVVVVALSGWFDVGSAATGALTWLCEGAVVHPVAYLDAEEFVDFRTHRPTIAYQDEGPPLVSWPHTRVVAMRTGGRHDLVLVNGIEPDYQWRRFTEAIVAVATGTAAELVVSLGSSVADVPHTRPLPMVTSAGSPELAARLGLSRPTYQGVTGVIGVLQERLGRGPIPGISVRASVPMYLSGQPVPLASQALLGKLGDLLGVAAASAKLDAQVRDWVRRANDAVAEDPSIQAHVSALEARYDARSRLVSSIDQLANDSERLVSELELFLREQAEGGGDGAGEGGPPEGA